MFKLRHYLIIDTIFAKINGFNEGLSIVQGLNHIPYPKNRKEENYEIGIIDSNGKFIIPYGLYSQIGQLEDGYFKVEIPADINDTVEGYTIKTGFVDKEGKLLFAKDHKNNSWISGSLKCGLAAINLYKYWIPEKEGTLYTTDKSYEGYINAQGKIVVNDTTYRYVYAFSDNRAFVRYDNWHYALINTQGRKINSTPYDGVLENTFKNKRAFVQVGDKWGLIDTNARFIISPRYDMIHEIGVVDNYFFYKNSRSDTSLWGIAKVDGTEMIAPIMEHFDYHGFISGLLKCTIAGKLTYINTKGEQVWQETITDDLRHLNITFMARGYYTAFSELKDLNKMEGGMADMREMIIFLRWAQTTTLFHSKNYPLLPDPT